MRSVSEIELLVWQMNHQRYHITRILVVKARSGESLNV